MNSVVFSILLFIVFVAFWLTSIIFSRLKNRHLKIFTDLGSPALITNNTPKTIFAFQKFLMLRRFRSLNDANLNLKCEALFWLQLFWIPALVVVPILFNKNA